MTERIYSFLMDRNNDAEDELPERVRQNVPRNGLRQVLGNSLQSSGDQIVNASTVLPWLFSVLGVPAALTGFLVPVRESGSMLPQAFLTPLVLKVTYRKWVFVTGALVQALSVMGMAGTAALAEGMTAGVLVLLFLVAFSLGRCLCSISSKDIQGRTIPKGERGQINGLATMASGLVAITLGVAIRIIGGGDLSASQLVWLLVGGGILWFLVALVYAGIREPATEKTTKPSKTESDSSTNKSGNTNNPGNTSKPDDTDAAKKDSERNWLSQVVHLLRSDKPFRTFVIARSLLLVSALAPPFIVTMSIQSGTSALAGLGGFVIASGVANLVGGRIFGRAADRSSRDLMSFGAALASTIIILTILALTIFDISGESWIGATIFIASYFLLRLTHTGVRVARKTYLVDMAEGDLRTTYTAVSNSAMGIILLLVGGVSSALAIAHINWALGFLAVMGILGIFAGRKLPDVSRQD